MLIYAIVFISLAFVFYTVGVWSEKFQGRLLTWHAVMFWIGLACDVTGTTAMSKLAGSSFQFNFHGITGMLAILIMLLHAVWATAVLVKNDEPARENFRKLSVHVWAIWLLPYISGLVFGIR